MVVCGSLEPPLVAEVVEKLGWRPRLRNDGIGKGTNAYHCCDKEPGREPFFLFRASEIVFQQPQPIPDSGLSEGSRAPVAEDASEEAVQDRSQSGQSRAVRHVPIGLPDTGTSKNQAIRWRRR
jgi:hypothetical protein